MAAVLLKCGFQASVLILALECLSQRFPLRLSVLNALQRALLYGEQGPLATRRSATRVVFAG